LTPRRFTLDDDEVVRVVLEGVSSCDHVCLESEEVFVAGRAVAPLFEGFGDLSFKPASVGGVVIGVLIRLVRIGLY